MSIRLWLDEYGAILKATRILRLLQPTALVGGAAQHPLPAAELAVQLWLLCSGGSNQSRPVWDAKLLFRFTRSLGEPDATEGDAPPGKATLRCPKRATNQPPYRRDET